VQQKAPVTIHKGDKTKVSPHFSASEWYSTSSDAPSSHPIYPQLIEAAEYLRNHFGVPWRITSSYRTEAHERQILAAMGKKFFVDQHMKGRAFDSHPVDTGEVGQRIKNELYEDFIANGPIYCALREIGITGFGIYTWGIHLDCRVDSFTAKRKDKWGYVACWDDRPNAKKKFGGAAFQTTTKTPTTPAPKSQPVFKKVAPGPGSSSR
jgi:hypothetical protein